MDHLVVVTPRCTGSILEEFIDDAPVNLFDTTDRTHRHPVEKEGKNLDALRRW
ncbi:MAG: hypothetical protein OXC19_07675 [Bryobacterales bacterium]|nr:hypothetical protein [Bryobacterales bacterium]